MALSQDRRGPGERKLTPLPRYFLKEGADALRDQRSHSLSGRWGGGGEKAALRASPTLQRLAPGTLPAGEGQRERRGEDRQGDLRVEGAAPPSAHCPPGRLFRRHRLLFTSTCSTGTSRGRDPPPPLPSRLFSTFHPGRGGVNLRPRGGGSRPGENLSLTWCLASGIYSLIPATLAFGEVGEAELWAAALHLPSLLQGPENPGGLPGRRSSV